MAPLLEAVLVDESVSEYLHLPRGLRAAQILVAMDTEPNASNYVMGHNFPHPHDDNFSCQTMLCLEMETSVLVTGWLARDSRSRGGVPECTSSYPNFNCKHAWMTG